MAVGLSRMNFFCKVCGKKVLRGQDRVQWSPQYPGSGRHEDCYGKDDLFDDYGKPLPAPIAAPWKKNGGLEPTVEAKGSTEPPKPRKPVSDGLNDVLDRPRKPVSDGLNDVLDRVQWSPQYPEGSTEPPEPKLDPNFVDDGVPPFDLQGVRGTEIFGALAQVITPHFEKHLEKYVTQDKLRDILINVARAGAVPAAPLEIHVKVGVEFSWRN